jgi:hypothetical protein
MARAKTVRVAAPLAVELLDKAVLEAMVRARNFLAPAVPVVMVMLGPRALAQRAALGDPTGAGDQIVRERRVAHPLAVKVAATRGVSAIRS